MSARLPNGPRSKSLDLSPSERRFAILRYNDEKEFGEIAAIMRIARQTAYKYQRRVYARLGLSKFGTHGSGQIILIRTMKQLFLYGIIKLEETQ